MALMTRAVISSSGKRERVVDGGDHEVELGENLVLKVEAAITEDIDFGTGEQVNGTFKGFVHFSDVGHLFEKAVLVESARLRGRFGVVGDAEIFEAEVDGGVRHLAQGIASVGLGGVTVKGAFELLFLLHKLGGGWFSAAASISPRFSRRGGVECRLG